MISKGCNLSTSPPKFLIARNQNQTSLFYNSDSSSYNSRDSSYIDSLSSDFMVEGNKKLGCLMLEHSKIDTFSEGG